jgi:hypothetical protein
MIDTSNEHTKESVNKVGLTKIFFLALFTIFTFCLLVTYFGFWRFSKTTTDYGILLVSANYLGVITSYLIWAFLFCWIYRIYSIYSKKYTMGAEIGCLIFGSLLAFFAAIGNGCIEDLKYFINLIIVNG